jgi:thiamine biosynthesis lipoprotein
MLTRRRLLTIAAAALATPAHAGARHEWTGQAMGSAARIVLTGCEPLRAEHVFRKVEAVIRQVEAHFSLHRQSELTRLNRIGWLRHPDRRFLDLFHLASIVHAATDGVFDPTIQPLWLAVAASGDRDMARRLLGWHRVRIAADEISLDPGMQLTFNGIAQGYAADRVADLMRAEGLADVLVDMGEVAGLGERPEGGGWQADIALADGTVVSRAILCDRALATSSPRATLIGAGQPHILNPSGASPCWQLASVSASRAALADALSTAVCLMERPAIDRVLARFPDARLEALV